ncbi:galactose oxidase-like domain-containing protein [Streptomyces sp. NPDC012794]|uniref:galactose oxidase-like domain-containing protein n=1 Tax=Streptomyces sp. NPDC012794 TaxID=3364850 RepID=UPI00369E2B6A
MPRRGVARALVASTVLSLLPAGPVAAHDGSPGPSAATAAVRQSPGEVRERVRREVSPAEARALGPERAEAHARTRLAVREEAGRPDTVRAARLASLTESQARANAGFRPALYGAFTEYFDSPDSGAHTALLPTGKVLLFSFEHTGAGRAFLWDPAKGTGAGSFEKVTPPRAAAPFFPTGHALLPSGGLVVRGAPGAHADGGPTLVFDPWTETWSRGPATSAVRRAPFPDGAGPLWGTRAPAVERFPARVHPPAAGGPSYAPSAGRPHDNTLLMPDGTLLTVSGAYDIHDYASGLLSPAPDPKYRQLELRDTKGGWRLGPVQRLPRGHRSNALVLPDGRVAITGDELQQTAHDADLGDGAHGTIEIYEPAYLHQGPRPVLDEVPAVPLAPGDRFRVRTSTPDRVRRAVLLAPAGAPDPAGAARRQVELRIERREGGLLTLQAPPTRAAAPSGHHLLFLLDGKGVPSVARWVRLA